MHCHIFISIFYSTNTISFLSTAIILLILIPRPFPYGPSLLTLRRPTLCRTAGARARNPPLPEALLFNVALHTAEISHFAPIQLDLKPDPAENLVLLISLPHPFDDRAPMHPKLAFFLEKYQHFTVIYFSLVSLTLLPIVLWPPEVSLRVIFSWLRIFFTTSSYVPMKKSILLLYSVLISTKQYLRPKHI